MKLTQIATRIDSPFLFPLKLLLWHLFKKMKRDKRQRCWELLWVCDLGRQRAGGATRRLVECAASVGGPQCSRVKWIIQICRLTRWWSIYLYIPNFLFHLLSLLSQSAPLLMSAIVAHVGVDFLGSRKKKNGQGFFSHVSLSFNGPAASAMTDL